MVPETPVWVCAQPTLQQVPKDVKLLAPPLPVWYAEKPWRLVELQSS